MILLLEYDMEDTIILEALIQSIGRPSNASSHGVGSFQNATIILRISESKKEDSIAAD